MQTPLVVCSILAKMGCISSDADVHVLVKEGTRMLECTTGGQSGDCDWKISFHFVFQISVSLFQFRCAYELMTSYMTGTSAGSQAGAVRTDAGGSEFGCSRDGCDDLAFFLGLSSMHDYERYLRRCGTHAAADEAELKKLALDRVLQTVKLGDLCAAQECVSWGGSVAALAGMDLHPRQNAQQGLGCLGSKKPGAQRGNRLVGMMKVSLAGLEEKGTVSASWLDGYSRRSHPLLVLTEASIVSPGPRCIPLLDMRTWRPFGSSATKDLSGLHNASASHLVRSWRARCVADGALPLEVRGKSLLETCNGSGEEETVIDCMRRMQKAEAELLSSSPCLQTLSGGLGRMWVLFIFVCIVLWDGHIGCVITTRMSFVRTAGH